MSQPKTAPHAQAVDVASLVESLESLMGGAYFVVDGERNILAYSDEMAQVTGLSREEAMGRFCLNAVRCPQCLQNCGVFEHGAVGPVELTMYHADGRALRVRKTARTVRGPEGQTLAVERLELVDDERPGADAPAPADALSATEMAANAMSPLFAALGRFVLVVDKHWQVVRAAGDLATLLGTSAEELEGTPLADLFGGELFGPESEFGRAVLAGERREGWRAELNTGEGLRPVSLSAARLDRAALKMLPCGNQAVAVVVVRPDSGQAARPGRQAVTFRGMVARSQPMRDIFHLIQLIHDNDARVLITGESGTGKELVARAVHAASHRAKGPFVAVNCGALPADLLESELFGHVKGAFTGAIRDKVGRFELADGGTLFLDEIGDLPLPLQVKLLRAIQEGTFERVGDSRPRQVDVRVVSATNRDLIQCVQEGTFRDDLYYRLRVVPIEVPPLRERREDLEVLIDHLLERIGGRRQRSLRLSPSALRALLTHDWPGNVRELENALEYATAVCEGQTIHVGDLPAELQQPQPARAPATGSAVTVRPPRSKPAPRPPSATRAPTVDWSDLSAKQRAEAREIQRTLEQTQWQRQEAAELLGMSRWTLWRRMKAYGLMP